MALKELLACVRGVYSSEIRYLHPSLNLICVDPAFEGFSNEERRGIFFDKVHLRPDDVDPIFAAGGVILHLATPSERENDLSFLDTSPTSHHWIEYLAGSNHTNHRQPHISPPIVHFYGFKGGQARSTVLAMLSKHFADDGYKVLAVDADVEAPSLHAVFETKILKLEGTLLGCVQYGLEISPQPVYLLKNSASQGRVDLLACKPSNADFDLDLASFALHSALDPTALQLGFERIGELKGYDLILVDHRSGLASTVLPVAAAFPGPVVVCLRLDEQSDEADNFFDVLFNLNSETPGLFVSFSLDPDDSREKLIGRNRPRVDLLLDTLSRAVRRGAVPGNFDNLELFSDPDDFQSYWVPWFHDRSFLAKGLPSLENILGDNKAALFKIRELIGLQASKRLVALKQPSTQQQQPRALTNSGNTDQGLLIQTETLRNLLAPNTPYTYVLGRKGTGKTRLVRALAEMNRGRPLLVADDFPKADGVLSSDPGFKDLTDLIPESESEKLWWVLLDAVNDAPTGLPRQDLLKPWLQKLRNPSPTAVLISEISERIQRSNTPRVFLIDGVETAFNSTKMGAFVEGLFRFLSAIQSNSQLSQRVTVRLFVRTDLARRAAENVEQQIEGRYLTLSWDTQTILNFALTRICGLDWFITNFRSTTENIQGQIDRLTDGAVPENECNAFLLEIFPEKIRRNNLLTLTFLKDYFSEGLGESASFYPRIYDTFLRSIAEPAMISPTGKSLLQIENGRVAQPLIVAAHDYASKEYLKQVAAELKYLLRLSNQPQENQELVDNLIEAFRGLPTPFELEECVLQVSAKLSDSFSIRTEIIRDSLQQMKRVGIFEDRPGYAGWWRAGRLFKNALGMKYVR